MSASLRELLGLPKGGSSQSSAQRKEFCCNFKQRTARLNKCLQALATKASEADYQAFVGQRTQVCEAFQKALSQLDRGDAVKAQQSFQRVLTAVSAVTAQAAAAAEAVDAASRQWAEQETDLDDALVQIGELEAARHPKAAVLRKLGHGIRCKANERNYAEASQAIEQLTPTLKQIYAEFRQEPPQPPREDGGGDGAGSPDRKPLLVKAFASMKPEIAQVMKVANTENTALLQKLVKAFGDDMKRDQVERSELILKKLNASIADINKRRADGHRKRRAEIASMRKQADAVMARINRIREDNRRAS